MGNDLTRRIENWFASDGEGEFAYSETAVFRVLGPATQDGRIIFAPKSSPVLSAICESAEFGHLGAIVSGGLPKDRDLRWISKFVGHSELWFLGDLDPADLMIFATLRARLPRTSIRYLGISDAYLKRLDIRIPPSFMIPLSPVEQRSLPLLEEAFPDFRETVGPDYTGLLASQYKVEIEAVVSVLDGQRPLLLSVLDS